MAIDRRDLNPAARQAAALIAHLAATRAAKAAGEAAIRGFDASADGQRAVEAALRAMAEWITDDCNDDAPAGAGGA